MLDKIYKCKQCKLTLPRSDFGTHKSGRRSDKCNVCRAPRTGPNGASKRVEMMEAVRTIESIMRRWAGMPRIYADEDLAA